MSEEIASAPNFAGKIASKLKLYNFSLDFLNCSQAKSKVVPLLNPIT
jgi:hypothetical protein